MTRLAPIALGTALVAGVAFLVYAWSSILLLAMPV
jgi:hypothetical protein